MRPWLTLRFRIGEQMDVSVGMRAKIIALEQGCTENFTEPAEKCVFRKRGGERFGPIAAEPIDFAPVLFPTQLRKNLAGLRKKLRQRRGRGKELNLVETGRDGFAIAQLIALRAKIAQQLEIIDQHFVVSATKNVFD